MMLDEPASSARADVSRIYELRRSNVSYLIANNIDIRTVADRTGHQTSTARAWGTATA